MTKKDPNEKINGLENFTDDFVKDFNRSKTAPINSIRLTDYNTRDLLYTLFPVVLAERYATDGLFKTLVEQPVIDAVKGELSILTSQLEHKEIEELKDVIEEKNIIGEIKNFLIWNRLFGGAGLIIQNPRLTLEEDFDINLFVKGDTINYNAVSRWDLGSITYSEDDMNNSTSDSEYFYYKSFKIKASNVFIGKGIEPPYYIRQMLNGWGLSVCESLIAPTNNYNTCINLIHELMSEGKLDVLQIQDLNSAFITGQEDKVSKRAEIMAKLKNATSLLMLDANDKFDTKQINLMGLVDILRELKLDICSAMKMPMTKLFGLSANGFNSGDADLQSYNQMIENEIRPLFYRILRKIVKIECKVLFDKIPSDIKVRVPEIKNISEIDKMNIKNSEYVWLKNLYDSKLLTSKELGEELRKRDILTGDTKLQRGELEDYANPEQGQEQEGQGEGNTPSTGKLNFHVPNQVQAQKAMDNRFQK